MSLESFLQTYPIKLTPQQEEAVRQVDGPNLLLAVPGSGKTTVLIARLGYMIYELNIQPESILTVTYTTAATHDMRERFRQVFGETYAARIPFQTINGLCARIIYYSSKFFNKDSFELQSDNRILQGILKDIWKEEKIPSFPTDNDLKDLQTKIAYAKNRMLTDEEIKAMTDADLPFDVFYKKYCDALKQKRWMDFDDQLVYAYRLLQNYPSILEYYQDKFPYICVDEAQDTSLIQHKIIALLARKRQNIFMVGDEDQSIYGFRAAYPEALTEFSTVYPNARILLMEDNFRSDTTIVTAADRFIQRNTLRHPKKMRAAGKVGARDNAIRTIELDSRRGQYFYLAKVADGCKNETAVLYRNNEDVLPLVDLLERREIPYVLVNRENHFFSHRIVLDIANIIRFAQYPKDAELFMQIYYKLELYLTKNEAKSACEMSSMKGITILEAAIQYGNLDPKKKRNCASIRTHLQNMLTERADKAVYRIRRFMGYEAYLERSRIKTGRLDILESIAVYEENPMRLLERLNILSDLVQNKTENGVSDHAIILSTVHSSKGLEYDTVYMMDVFDGQFPESPLPNFQTADLGERKVYEEERRLFYVGMTRAKRQLVLPVIKDSPSCFVQEIIQPKSEKTVVHVTAYENEEQLLQSFMSECKTGAVLYHKTFGEMRILSKCEDIITVRLKDGSQKKFNLQVLFEKRLLKTGV